jgi:hypothetical protein
MRSALRASILVAGSVLVLSVPIGASAAPPAAAAATSSYEITKNLHPLGYSPFSNTPNLPGLTFTANSDLAFWGDLAFQGHYTGFRIVDISSPAKPREISFTECVGNQGDIVVYGDILVRAWNSPATGTGTSLLSCDGVPVPLGWEGLHIFDISDLSNPVVVGSVEISARPQADAVGCGSHTVSAVPDGDSLVVYNQSAGTCTAAPLHVFEIPLDDPSNPTTPIAIGLEDAMGCHDSGIILGDVNLLACASHMHTNVFDIGANQWPGGSLTDPNFLYTVSEPGVCSEPGNPLCNGNWHSAAFSLDGDVLILGWEPGGGSLPECEASDPAAKKSYFFYNAETGAKLGQLVLPRPQGPTENCTIHNYNVVPTDKRRVLVAGNYQAGISVVDFTNPANAVEIAYADPAPLSPTQLGGDWSTYWYNGHIYESDITRGLIVWKLSDSAVAGARKLPYLNPQSAELSFP